MDAGGGARPFCEQKEATRLRQRSEAYGESRTIRHSGLLKDQDAALGRQPSNDAQQFVAEAAVHDQPLTRHPLAALHGPSYSEPR
jgi:hypothetical protein